MLEEAFKNMAYSTMTIADKVLFLRKATCTSMGMGQQLEPQHVA